ncbi:MAG: DNA translocase FtsK 4TM domain-containing protein, partial [Novosphingobium sp.]
MASQPMGGARRANGGNWRVAMRRSLRRAGEMGSGLALAAASAFLALALASYHQTDPSMSTAAGGAVLNWMGASGAWTADLSLMLFGPVAVLLVPLLFVS